MNHEQHPGGNRVVRLRRSVALWGRGLRWALCWGTATAAANGQELLLEVSGDTDHAGFGYAIAAAGDFDSDGYPDVVVGIPWESNGTIVYTGNAQVFSGKDGSILHSVFGQANNESLGWSVAGGFDMNLDGYADFLVGAPGAPFGQSRRAVLYSGKDGSVLWSADGDDSSDGFGYSVANAGDVNQDGANDWVVGAPYAVVNGVLVGFVRVFSGLDGSVLSTVYGSKGAFGFSVGGAGDVDGDGVADIVVGDPGSSVRRRGGGRALAYSGKTGASILDVQGDLQDDLHLGWSVSGIGDVDLDGFDDVVVGSNQYRSDACGSYPEGFAWVYSGQTGAALYQYRGDADADVFGISVHGCGDVNRDGWPDFIIGAPQFDNTPAFGHCGGPGYARLYSGRTGLPLYTFTGRGKIDNFGIAVSDAGDLNLDGFPDVAVGATGTYAAGGYVGSVYVFGGNDLFLSASSRKPKEGDVLTLSTREGPAGNLVALFLVEVNGSPLTCLLGGGTFDSTMGFAFSGTVPVGFSGNEFAFQSFAIGPTGKVIGTAPEAVTIQ